MTGELFAVAALVMFSLNIILTKLASNRLNLNAGFLISITVNLAFSAAVFLIELTLRRDPLMFNGFAIAMFMLAGACSTYSAAGSCSRRSRGLVPRRRVCSR